MQIGRAIARNPVFGPFVVAEMISGDAVADAEAIAANVAVYGHLHGPDGRVR